jgi:hypothetical protein
VYEYWLGVPATEAQTSTFVGLRSSFADNHTTVADQHALPPDVDGSATVTSAGSTSAMSQYRTGR